VRVAVGVVRHPVDGRILLARRPPSAHLGGLWEFPGGKVEPGEFTEAALQRELREEVDIGVRSCHALLQVAHDYADRRVLLEVWQVDDYEGEPRSGEGQELRWVAVSELPDIPLPAANREIVSHLLARLD
jgi:8-oxo-dGTP diphosphatase